MGFISSQGYDGRTSLDAIVSVPPSASLAEAARHGSFGSHHSSGNAAQEALQSLQSFTSESEFSDGFHISDICVDVTHTATSAATTAVTT